jgi:hypothetical protein
MIIQATSIWLSISSWINSTFSFRNMFLESERKNMRFGNFDSFKERDHKERGKQNKEICLFLL